MKKKLLLQDFADYLVLREGIGKKEAEAFVRAFFEVIEQGLLEDKFVKIKGFGTFKLVAVSERESVNISTGERFQISGHTKVTFLPDNALKELVNRPFAHFEAVDLNDDTDTREFEEIDLEWSEEEETDEPETDTAAENDETPEEENEEVRTEEVITLETAHHAQPDETEAADPATPAENETPETMTVKVEAVPTEAEEPEPEPQAMPAPAEPATENAHPQTAREEAVRTEGTDIPAPAQPAAQADHPEPAQPAEEEEIVVTDPTPINDHTAPQTGMEKTSNTLGYVYEEVPTRRKHNIWKIAVMCILVLLLMAASYFAGYFRLLCPCTFMEMMEHQTQPVETRPAAAPHAAQPAAPRAAAPQTQTNDSAAGTKQPAKNDASPQSAAPSATPPEAQAQTPQPAPKQAQAAQPAQTAEPARPKTHKVKVGDNVYRISRKYYGSDKYADAIIKLNKLENADNIVLGSELKLP